MAFYLLHNYMDFIENDQYIPCDIYSGEGTFVADTSKSDGITLEYKINHYTNSELIVKNFTISSGMDLKSDFKSKSYIIPGTSSYLYSKLLDSLHNYQYSDDVLTSKSSPDEKNDNSNSEEKNHTDVVPICNLGQKHTDSIKYFNYDDKPRSYDKLGNRPEFQRDREKIIHSKSYRRLVDKAQIFTTDKGDHFRTRMTHTQEVAQIAREISRRLNLNEDLTEAIALAHDIGHTPFGHQGERTLQTLLDEQVQRLPETMQGGKRFKHNFQGLRVLTYLEEKYIDFEGLNLSYQVLEGVLKHTKSCPKGVECPNANTDSKCNHSCVDLDIFLVNGDKENLFLDYKFPTTLEGQVVAIADEIAQRGHDLDDAFASKLLSYGEFEQICNIAKLETLKNLTIDIREKAEKKRNEGFYYTDIHNVIRAELVSSIIGSLIKDVVDCSREKLEVYHESKNPLFKKNRVGDLLIEFSSEQNFIVEYLENEISKKVINSQDVVTFDFTSERIIRELFESYLNNPNLLPDSALRRLFKDIKKGKELDVIDFRDSDLSLISKELDKIKLYDCGKKDSTGENSAANNAYAKKFLCLLYTITDHISGMTDNYAKNEFEKLKGNC